jgi:glycosyltransferase involved in cell wall biosynthesis
VAGRNIDEEIAPADLLRRSAHDLEASSRVIAPSQDAANRMRRHFPNLPIDVVPWEDAHRDDTPQGNTPQGNTPWEDFEHRHKRTLPTGQTKRVCVVGGIGVEKGFEILLACAEDAAARGLALEFVVVGYTIDDAKLHATGRVFVTGTYGANELPGLIIRQAADVAFLPSIWPETWCFALSEMWRAGLSVLAFDIGAPSERIRANGRGWLMPLGLPPGRINDLLLGRLLTAVNRGRDGARRII